jgi:hypothetical protein
MNESCRSGLIHCHERNNAAITCGFISKRRKERIFSKIPKIIIVCTFKQPSPIYRPGISANRNREEEDRKILKWMGKFFQWRSEKMQGF